MNETENQKADEAATTAESGSQNNEIEDIDLNKFSEPLGLLKALLFVKHKYAQVKVESLCAEMTKETGMSWNKQFKPRYGQIERFLRKNDDVFELSTCSKLVRLKETITAALIRPDLTIDNDLDKLAISERKSSSKTDEPPNDADTSEQEQKWYDFDDSRVRLVEASAIRKQFEGKESAYMLFYRRKKEKQRDMTESLKDHHEKIPKWLVDEVQLENEKLKLQRDEHDRSLNQTSVEVYLDTDFYIEKNILNLHEHFEAKHLKVFIDKQTTIVDELDQLLIERCTNHQANGDDLSRREAYLKALVETHYLLLVCRVDLSNSGRFSYYVKSVLKEPKSLLYKLMMSTSSKDCVIVISRHLDLWPIGDDYQPVRLVFKYYSKNFEIREVSCVFALATTVKSVKEEISTIILAESLRDNPGMSEEELTGLDTSAYIYSLIKGKAFSKPDPNEKMELTANEFDCKTLKELEIRHGDVIIAESNAYVNHLFDNKMSLCAPVEAAPKSLKIEIKFLLVGDNSDLELHKLSDIEDRETIKDARFLALSCLSSENPMLLTDSVAEMTVQNTHFRYLDLARDEVAQYGIDSAKTSKLPNTFDTHKLLPVSDVIYDDITLSELIESNTPRDARNPPSFLLLLCRDRAPIKSHDEITLKCTFRRTNYCDVILSNPAKKTIDELTSMLADRLQLPKLDPKSETTYFLKTLDWFGDVESILNDFSLTCLQAQLKHNQMLHMDCGVLLLPNHVKIFLWTSCDDPIKEDDSSKTELDLNQIIEKRNSSYALLKELTISMDTRFEELKELVEQILVSNETPSQTVFKDTRMRLMKRCVEQSSQEVNKFQLKKPLIEWHKTLRQAGLRQASDICVQLLDDFDSLNQGIVILETVRIDLKSKLCAPGSYRELLWNVNNGATLSSLKEAIARAYADQLEPADVYRISLAKRLFEKHQWIILKENSPTNEKSTKVQQGGKKGGGGGNKLQKQTSVKSNLRQSPYNISDGDLVAFGIFEPIDASIGLNRQHSVSAQDFMSTQDLDFVKKASERRPNDAFSKSEKSNSDKSKRPEIGISIKIDDFNDIDECEQDETNYDI